LEPTGRYSTPVAALARQADRSVLLAPPRQAKSFLRSIQCRAKTDRLDSQGLALFALSQSLAPYPLKTPMQEQIDQLLLARKGMARAAASLGQQIKELPHAKEPLQKALAEMKAQLRVLDAQITALTTQPELAAAARLRKVPGIGPVTAAALASRLAGKRFSHPDKLVAYIGLDIGVQQSGRKKGERGLTKQGDAELRRLLFVCASASLRAKDTVFKDQYERERAKGLATTAALCAVARKMAKVCWSLARHGTDYDQQRVRQQITPPKNLAKPLDNEP
jgi:transposase